MIHDIREAFNELLEENEWMDDKTRVFAKEKVKRDVCLCAFDGGEKLD